MVWFKASELLGALAKIGVARSVATVGANVYDHRTNTTLAGTWALAHKPSTGSGGGVGKLHAIGPDGSWYAVDPQTGQPALLRERLEPGGSLIYAGDSVSSQGLLNGQSISGGLETHWEVTAGRVSGRPYLRDHLSTYWVHPPFTVFPAAWVADCVDGFWVAPYGGTAKVTSGISYAASWANGPYANLVHLVTYNQAASGGPAVQGLWNSTGTGPQTPAGPPPPQSRTDGIALRTSLTLVTGGTLAPYTYQALRLANVSGDGLQTVASTPGGKVVLLDPTLPVSQPIRGDSDDFGFGGSALATYDFDGDGKEEVLFASLYEPVGIGYEPAQAVLRLLKWNATPTSGFKLESSQSVPVGDPLSTTHDFEGYGACGIAVAELDSNASNGPEILVTTLNGELVVFGSSSPGQPPQIGAVLDRELLPSALGIYNSIVVGDYNTSNGTKPEVYVASSGCLRRFDVQ